MAERRAGTGSPRTSQSPVISVAVPVRDERRRLPGLLEALQRQRGIDPRGLRLFLLFDGCEDGGLELVRQSAPQYGYAIECALIARSPVPNAGRARAAAMDFALAHGTGPADYLLTTDADTIPDARWCAANRASLADVDLVAGRILRKDRMRNPERSRLEDCLDRVHRLRRAIDPLPWEGQATHGSIGGASLAFTPAAYRQLGGFSETASGEDALIVQRARREGLKVRQDPAVRVITSSRMTGRATGGLADALRQSRGRSEHRFSDPEAAIDHYRRQALARASHMGGKQGLARLARKTGLSVKRVIETALEAPNGEAFVHRLLPDSVELPQIALTSVEARLTRLELDLAHPASSYGC